MANITESAVWATFVTQLDTTTQVLGGTSGPSNVPLKQLADRTAYLKAQVEGKAPIVHDHTIAGVTGLQAALDAKAAAAHDHGIGGVTGLQAALDAKAAAAHDHGIGGVTGLQAALDAKAASAHLHGVSSITGLQAALDAKAPSSHGHGMGDVSGLGAALAGKSALGHSHGIGDVTGLDAALAGKSASGHGHGIGDVTGLQAALDSKAPAAFLATSFQDSIIQGVSTSPNGAVMLGLGAASARIVPTRTGRVLVVITGALSTNVIGSLARAMIAYGAGTPPARGAAPIGTLSMARASFYASAAGQYYPFCLTYLLTNLTPGVQYWVDLEVSGSGSGMPEILSGANAVLVEV